MNISTTPIDGLLVLQPKLFGDKRGFFMESFNQASFDAALEAAGQPQVGFVQDNHSRSAKGVLRGLHYQLGSSAQGKLVRVTAGSVWDVAVDMRRSSPTFGYWHGLELSSDNHTQFWIPPGFAHGFLVLSDSADFLYKTTQYHDPKTEQSVLWSDKDLNIMWPFQRLGFIDPIVSAKDQQASAFSQAHCFS